MASALQAPAGSSALKIIRWYLDAVNIDYTHAIQTINRIPKLYA